MKTVGVLALQGDVREHAHMLESLEVTVKSVKTPAHFAGVDALVIPGGESTTIAYLLTSSGLRTPLGEAIAQGFPVFGTCAGLIMLARGVSEGRADQWSYGALDVDVRRNGYGRQTASFEDQVAVEGLGDVPGVFIRAPRIERVGATVSVLATYDHGDGAHPVLVREGNAFGCSFHPELTSDNRIHGLFVAAL